MAVSEEIASQQDDISIKLIVTDENAQLLAEAIVNIWIMIEDEINIVLMVFMSSVLLFVILPRKWISVIAMQGT